MLLTREQTTYVGPGQVLQVAGNRVQLKLSEESAWAQVALAYPYQPAAGDTVLAIGQQDNWYVIGVLRGEGATTFTVPGDLKIQAPRGRIELCSAEEIQIKSPAVKISAHRLEFMARAVVEKFGSATRWVQEAFHLNVGRMRTRARSSYDLKTDRLHARAEGDVKIDGRKIHLG